MTDPITARTDRKDWSEEPPLYIPLPPPQREPAEVDAPLDGVFERVSKGNVSTLLAPQSPVSKALTEAAPLSPKEAHVQERLDAFRRAWSGPYRVGPYAVEAAAQFRMNVGTPSLSRAATETLSKAAQSAKITNYEVGLLQVGRGTAAQLQRLTQGLLDAGALDALAPQTGAPASQSLPDRIRAMQANYNVGVDCAGYVRQAFLTSRAKGGDNYGLKSVTNEDLGGLWANSRFRRVDPTAAKAGDIVVLRPIAPDTVGHRAIVYSHVVASEPQKRLLQERYGKEAEPLLTGSVHVYQVDSSWGSSNNTVLGGAKRETWIYDEATKVWGSYRPARNDASNLPGRFLQSPDGPYRHSLEAFYRPKDEP